MKTKKHSSLFMSAPMKDILKKVKYSREQLEAKKAKRTQWLD